MNTGDLFFNHQVIKSLDFHNKNTSLCGDNVFFSNLQPGLIYGPKKELGIPHQSLFRYLQNATIFLLLYLIFNFWLHVQYLYKNARP